MKARRVEQDTEPTLLQLSKALKNLDIPIRGIAKVLADGRSKQEKIARSCAEEVVKYNDLDTPYGPVTQKLTMGSEDIEINNSTKYHLLFKHVRPCMSQAQVFNRGSSVHRPFSHS